MQRQVLSSTVQAGHAIEMVSVGIKPARHVMLSTDVLNQPNHLHDESESKVIGTG